MLVSLALTVALLCAPPPARAAWHHDVGEAWRTALPASASIPIDSSRVAAGTTVAVIETGVELARLQRSLPPRITLPAVDLARERVVVIGHDGASQLDFHGVARRGATMIVRWAPSPYFVAFAGPQLLVVVVPRAGADRLEIVDLSLARSHRPGIPGGRD